MEGLDLPRASTLKCLATARDFELTDRTKLWLDKHYPGIFSDVMICNHYGDNFHVRLNKTDVCKTFDLKYFLDDRPDNIKCKSIKTIVFDQPWNRENEEDRVTNWKDVEMYFLNAYYISHSDKIIRIGISGKIGSGKSCVCEMIQEMLPCLKLCNFADRIKDIVAVITGVDKELCYTREGKNIVPKGFDRTIGQLLQIVSQSLKKELGDDIWVKCIVDSNQFDNHILIGDVRFQIEVNALMNKNTHLLRINGDPVKIREKNDDGRDLDHISETDLDDYPFNHIIENNNSLDELRENVRLFLLSVLQ